MWTTVENILYGYSQEQGDQKKKLEQPDITGIQELYGE